MAGVGLADRDDGDAVGAALRRQPEIDDLGELLLQQRYEHLVQRLAEDRRLVGRAAGEGREVDRLPPHGDGADPERRKALDAVVIAGVVAIGAFVAFLVGHDAALDDDLGLGRHLERHGAAVGERDLLLPQQAGELVFRERIRHRRDRGDHGRRVGADHGGGRKALAPLLRRGLRLPACELLRAAAVVQPAHQGAVRPGHLHPVDAEVEAVGALALRRRAAGDDERPGDERRGLAGPAGLHRQAAEVDGVALQHDLLARRAAHRLRFHRQHLARQRDQLQRFAEAAGGLRLAQEGKHLADFAQLFRRPSDRLRDPFDGAEQVDQHRHVPASRAVLRPLEQDRRPAFQKRRPVDARHLQHGRDRAGLPAHLAIALKLREEIAQGGIGRAAGAHAGPFGISSGNAAGSGSGKHAGHMAQSPRKDKRAEARKRLRARPARVRSYNSLAPGIRSLPSPLRDRMRL